MTEEQPKTVEPTSEKEEQNEKPIEPSEEKKETTTETVSELKEKNEEEENPEEPITETEKLEFPMEEDLNANGVLTRTITPKGDTKQYSIKVEITLSKNEKIQFHWGVFRRPQLGNWIAPPESYYPKEETSACDSNSANTNFVNQKINFELNLSSTDKELFHGVNFVFHNLGNEKWYNNHGSNYRFELIPKEKKKVDESEINVPECISDGMNCEATAGSWCLMFRYQKVRDAIFQLDMEDPKECVWIYLWLRYSFRRLLEWQRHYNTPPKDLQWSMHCLTFEITKRFSDMIKKGRNDKEFVIPPSVFLRDSLVMCGKGRSNGQLIRDEILNIFHKFKISEKIDSFYEQWHQKLHNNTTPDDIVICQALVNFLRTNNMAEYHNTLKYGGVTKERLESFERKIVLEPYYAPEYLPDFERFLGILKDVHSSTDLVTMFDQAKYAFNGNNKIFEEIIYFKDDWDTLKQIWRVTNGRECLNGLIHGCLDDHGRLRDLLFFDGSLVIYLRQIIEKILHVNMDFSNYVNEVTALLKNISISYDNYPEIKICFEDWIAFAEGLKEEVKKGNQDAAMKVKAVTDRVSRLLGHIIDYYNTQFGPRAVIFGNGCKIDKYYVDLFTEEEIRGSIFFALSMILKKIEPVLRQKANLGNWLIISRGEKEVTKGKLRFEKDLHKVQLEKFNEKTILIVENVGGNEEIPLNCAGVIIVNSNNYPDMLAHVSVRARNLKVPLLVSFSADDGKQLCDGKDKFIELTVAGEKISYKIVDSEVLDENVENKEEKGKVEPVKISQEFKGTYIEIPDFANDKVGAKSNNTSKVYKKLPDWVHYPESFAIPFNVQDFILNLPGNEKYKEKITSLIKEISNLNTSELAKATPLLEKAASITKEIKFPESTPEVQALIEKLKNFGVPVNDVPKALKAIKAVWASKYNERAFIACTKVGVKLSDIYMAVLCQKIIPADYAFVIHTKNPSTNDSNEVYCEIVYGMGETLVGSYEGQSLSFVYNKSGKNVTIKSYPNKSIALKNSGFIFRSDSNTEDLEGFAGAGLFDSVPMIEDNVVNMSYKDNQIFKDAGFVKGICEKVAELGVETEKLFNGEPQDIEGVFYKGEYYIVQTRPQV